MTLLDGQSGSLARSPKRRHASRIAGLAAAVIATLAFTGWRAGLPLLSSWGASLPATRPLAAICLLALGLALAYPGKNRRFAVAAGTAVATLAVFLLGASLLSLDTGVPWLSLHVPVPILAPGGSAPGYRLAHVAALAFGLTGAALALSGWDRCRLLATAIAGIAAAVVVFALLGYLTGIDALYGTAPLTAPPLPTAAGLLSVTLGVLLIGSMPTLRTPRPLWQLLAMLGCAIIGPLALFGAYAEVSISDAEIDLARKELMHGAHAVSADYDRQIAGEIGWLKALASSPSLHQGDYAAFQRQAEAALKLEPAGDIVLFDRNLHQLVDTRTPDGSAMVRATVPELAATALASGKPQFTGLFRGDATGRGLFAIVLPVEIGENRYALMKSIGQSALMEPLTAENLPPRWQGAVSNGSGAVLAQTGVSAEDEEKRTVPPQADGHRSLTNGVFEFADATGQPALAGYAVSELTGWETDMWEPKATFEAPVQALWRTLCWLALLSLGLVLGLALWLSRLIARSVGQAASAATAPQYGGTLLPDGTPVAEVNTLMAELHEAAARREASERLLRDSERQLRLIADNVPVAIVRCDVDSRCMFVNRLFVERHGHGLTCDEIISKPLLDVIGQAEYAVIERCIAECLAGHVVECAFEVPGSDGEPVFVQGRFAPEWRDGEVVGLIGATSDITRLKRAEQRLRASEAAFRQLIDNSPFGVYVVDDDLRIVQVSMGARKTFEPMEPLIGRGIVEVMSSIWPDAFASDAIHHFRCTLDTGESYRAPIVERRKDTGDLESYDWKIERVTMPDSRFGVVCHFYDLSERQRYEAALRESEMTFRAMFNASAVGKAEIDVETGLYIRVNAALCRFLGYSEAELLSRTVFDITHPDDRDEDRESLRSMDAGALPVFDREKRYIRKDGQTVWARVTANTIRDEVGRPVRNTAVVQDLTDRKRVEQDLEASRTRLQLALNAARLGWFQYDPVRRSGRGDTRFREIFELDQEEITVEGLMAQLHPDDLERARKSLAEHIDPVNPKPAVIELRIRRRNGEIRWIELHGLANFEGIGRDRHAVNLIGTAQDITERKQHEEQTHLLMREVNHRAKNMLSVVDAIAHQTAARNPDDFIDRFSERIQALSANQDLLVRNEWNGVDIADLVRAQLAHFADLIGSRIKMRGPRLRLNAASAQAIGLALHELSTNAGKYGALSNDKGYVVIRWRTSDGKFEMKWAECGGPPVSPPERRGFGTVVMEAMAERTVGGEVGLDYEPSGVRWHLTCPAANVLETREREQNEDAGAQA